MLLEIDRAPIFSSCACPGKTYDEFQGRHTMTTYQIVSSAGVDFGTYTATTAEEALDAMARDAGYHSAADAAEQIGVFDGSIVEIEEE